MRGPFLPIYGSGAIMMLLVSMPFQDSILMVYVAGCLGATVLEYVTGVVMEALFKVRYWDYSNQKFNFQGHICLSSSLAWGFLTIVMTEWLHKPVQRFVLSIPESVLTGITFFLTAVIFADFALSFKAALDLRDVLVKMEKAKEEMMHIQKRLDVLIALTNEELANRREEFAENVQLRKEELAENVQQKKEEWSENLELRMEDVKENIEDKLERMKELASMTPGEQWEEWKNEFAELKEKYTRSLEERERMSSLRDFFQRNLVRSHPSMSSERFKEALEEIKKRAEEWKNHKE